MKKITSTAIIIALGVMGLFLIVCAGLLYKYSNYSYVLEAATDAYDFLFLGLIVLFFLILFLRDRSESIYPKIAAILVLIGLFLCQLFFSAFFVLSIFGDEGWVNISLFFALIFFSLDLVLAVLVIRERPNFTAYSLAFLISTVPIILLVSEIYTIPADPFNNIAINTKNTFRIDVENKSAGKIGLPFKEKPASLIPFGGSEDFYAKINTFTYTGMYFYWNDEVEIYSSNNGTISNMLDFNSYKNYSFSVSQNGSSVYYGRLASVDPEIKEGARVKKGQLLGRAKSLFWTFGNSISNNKFENFDTVSCPADHLSSESRKIVENIPLESNYAQSAGGTSNICGN